ncbi:MAG: RsmB/NOP family class I SAM-dependent RNA methyltransferase [Methylophilaceae bacterium]
MNNFILDSLIKILLDFEKNTGPADLFLSAYFKKNYKLGHRDRSLIAEIYYGVIRHKSYLENICGDNNLKNKILIFLLYVQGKSINSLTHFLDDETLSWLKIKKSSNYVCESWPIKLSVPNWLWIKLSISYEESFLIELAKSLLKPADLNLRVNGLKKTKIDDIVFDLKESFPMIQEKIKKTNLSPIGIVLPRGTQVNKHHLFLDGTIEVQDEGSQILSLLLNVKRGQMVADFCAGAGGKTLALADLMKNTGRLYAFDISDKRLENLKRRLKKSGASNIFPQRINNENDIKIKRLYGKFDRVFVDAPCTGFGTLRRNPDLKWRYGESDLHEIVKKQKKILDAASNLCKKGGYLLYATCSILNDENEEIVESFLQKRSDFKAIPYFEILENIKVDTKKSNYLKLFPHQHGTDGFFGAIMERI